MKHLPLTLALFTFTNLASSHYVFNRLIINSTISREFQYVRDVTGNAGTYDNLWLKTFPIYGPENLNITCGRGSFPVQNADTIETATILAGSEVGFMVSGPWYEGDVQGYIFHEGPAQVFMSALPKDIGSLNDYEASGHEFFKIAYAGPLDAHEWSTMNQTSVNFTIPATTPNGQYLLRIEHFLPSSNLGQSQWFVNCAHVQVVGGSAESEGVKPGPVVRFPNAYREEDPSIWFHDEEGYTGNLSKYVEPKPGVWKG